MNKKKRNDINFLKTIAIIAVILFHIDLLPNGYLGVDIFLVIAGFLTTKSILEKINKGTFSYKDFMMTKICRLLPVLIIGTFVTLLISIIIGMLPDNLENLSESIVASNIFSNNILSALTTKDYWDVVNAFKPLYHTWYIGVLFEFYIIYPLLLLFLFKKKNNKELSNKKITVLLAIITFTSLFIYILPMIPEYMKFYYIPFRFFEFSIGGLSYLFKNKISKKIRNYIYLGVITIIIVLLCTPMCIISSTFMLLLIVLLTAISIYLNADMNIFNRFFEFTSKRTYSFYIWHQIIFAFYRCYISSIDDFKSIITCLFLTIIISLISYQFIEAKVKTNKKNLIIYLILNIIISIIAILIYLHAGVIRDVKELDVEFNNVSRGMHASYCDRVYKYNKLFENNKKINILIIGNSFARDFANMLLESEYSDFVNIQYHFNYSDLLAEEIKKSDYIFIFGEKSKVDPIIYQNAQEEKIYGIGTKNFGESNERFYINRNKKDYYKQTVYPTKDIIMFNETLSNQWKDNYINILETIKNEDGTVNIFTDDGKFISQDCRHLTQNGAIYLSQKIDFSKIFTKGE